jgi:hypothetical protein
MHYTIFDTPILRDLMRALSIFLLRLRGWRIDGNFPGSTQIRADCGTAYQ